MDRSDNPPRQAFLGGAGGSPLSATTFRFPCRSLYHVPGGPGRSATPTCPLGLQLLSTSSLGPHEPQQAAWPYILGMRLTQPHCGGFALIVLLSGVSPTPHSPPHRTAGLPSFTSLGASPHLKRHLLPFHSSAPCFTLFPFLALPATSTDIMNLCLVSISPTQNASPARVSYRAWVTAHTQ